MEQHLFNIFNGGFIKSRLYLVDGNVIKIHYPISALNHVDKDDLIEQLKNIKIVESDTVITEEEAKRFFIYNFRDGDYGLSYDHKILFFINDLSIVENFVEQMIKRLLLV